MKKALVIGMLLLSLMTASLSFGQATMYVSVNDAFACTNALVMKYMMLLFLQEDPAALKKTIDIALGKGDIVPLYKGEKVFYLSHDNELPMLVWIRKVGDPRPVITFGDYFK